MALTVFPSQVLSRIAPDVLLQRHLAQGLRPSLRNFDEFRPFEASSGSFSGLGTNSVVGLSTVRNGDTFAFCGITIGVVESNGPAADFATDSEGEYASVYPVVEITRGRTGAPTDEEMILAQLLHDTLFHEKLIPLLLLTLLPGYQIANEDTERAIMYPEDMPKDADLESFQRFNMSKKTFRYVLYAHVKVFSRCGPLFDLVHYATVEALKNVSLPKLYLADSEIDPKIRIPIRSRGNFGSLSQTENCFYVDERDDLARPLQLQPAPLSSSFGVVEYDGADKSQTVLLADLEGEAEEFCAESRINVVAAGDVFKHVNIVGGGANVTLDTVRAALAKARARTA